MQFALPTGGMISHPNLVAALAKPGDAILATLTAEQADAWHMSSCIPGEAGELFEALIPLLKDKRSIAHERAHLVEELGDIEFYTQGLRALLGTTREQTMLYATVRKVSAYSLPVKAAEVFDATKKWVVYNKPLDAESIVTALGNLELVLVYIRNTLGITLKEVLAANVIKLGVRYSSLSYSDDQAQARADKAVN